MAEIKKINIKGTPYDIVDTSAVHTVDSALSSTSENPVQNKVINTALGNKEDKSNKVTALSSSSTDTQYPSAKITYNELQKRMFVYQLVASPTQTSVRDDRILFTYQSSDMMAIASYWASYNEFAITTSTTINNKTTQIIATKSRTTQIDAVSYYLFNGVLSNGKDDTQTLPFVIALGVNSTSGILYFNHYANAIHQHGRLGTNGNIESSDPVPVPILNDDEMYQYGILVNDQGSDGTLEPSAITFGRDDKNAFLSKDGTWSSPTAGHFDVVGANSTAAKTTSPYCAAIWKGSNSDINALYDGLSINYTLDVTGHDTYGTVLNLNDLGNHPVLINTGAGIGDTYAAGARLQLVYDATATASVYINSASASSITGCWKLAIAEVAPYFVQGSNSTAADTASPYYASRWRGTNDAIKSLYTGLTISYKIDVAGNSTYGVVLDLNGWGEHPVVRNASTNVSTAYPVGAIVNLIYDAAQSANVYINSTDAVSKQGCWKIADYDANTNTIGYQLRTNSYQLNTADAFRYYKILFTSADGTKWVPAASSTTNSATSKKTVNQRPINPFGEIVYCSSTTNYAANAAISATTIWQQYTLTLGYSFNRTGAALTLTTKPPVYVKCAPQSDGSAIIDADIPYVQTLPNEEDGKIYILLGMAYSATAIELLMNHPIYYYKDGAIRVWTNPAPVEEGFSGSYNDLTNKPADGSATIATVASDIVTLKAGVAQNNLTISNSSGSDITLAKVAKTGSYNDLSNKPTIPTVGSLNTNNSSAQSVPIVNESFGSTINLHRISKTGAFSDLIGKPSTTVHLYKGNLNKETLTVITYANLAEYTNTVIDINVGDTILGANGYYGRVVSWDTATHSGNVLYVDELELDVDVSSLTGVVPLSKGGTGIDAGNVQNWYTSAALYPHFIVIINTDNMTFNGGYYGSLDGITDVSSALASDSVKRALNTEVPVYANSLSGPLLFTGTIMTNALGGHPEQLYILFPDAVNFGGTPVNGISGTLTFDAMDGLYLANISVKRPLWLTAFSDWMASLSCNVTLDPNQTITQLTQMDGQVTATVSDIAITSDQVTKYTTDATIATNDKLAVFDASDLNKLKGSSVAFDTTINNKWLCQDGTWSAPSGLAPGAHSHGHLQNGGTMSDATSSSTIVNGDKLVITKASDGSLSTSTTTFDGSTTTQFLSKKGTWESIPSGPMVLKGTVGDSAAVATIAWTTLLSSSTTVSVGDTYKVVNAHSTAPICKAGDTIICTTGGIGSSSVWTVIPSGDEPSGTVTSVGISNGGGLAVSGSPITTSGAITISHADTSSQASVDNSGVTFIQDVSLDGYGHVTSLGSKTITKSDITGLGIPASDTNTTYTLSGALSDHKFTSTLTADGSDSGASTSDITLAAGSNISLVDNTSARKITINAVNTTYTFANGTNGFTVTPSGGTAQTVTVTPSIANNITGSGSSGAIAKFNGNNTITSGPVFNATHNNTFLRKDGEWATPPGGGTGNSSVYEDGGSATTLIDGFYVDSANLIDGPSGLWTNSKKLVIPTVDTTLDSSSGNAIANSTVTTALNGKAPSAHTHGNINSVGQVASTVVSSTTSDYLLFSDASNSGKVERQGFQAITSTLINSLSEGTSPNVANDYLITQYAGGGTSNTGYYRRKLSNVLGNVYWANTKVAFSSSNETTPIFASTTSTNVNLRQSSSVTTVGATMSYDATEEAIKFTFA